MPRRDNIETIRLPGWTGGLNTDADPFQLETDEVSDAMNIVFGLRGAVSKRQGFTRYDSPNRAEKFRRLASWRESVVLSSSR